MALRTYSLIRQRRTSCVCGVCIHSIEPGLLSYPIIFVFFFFSSRRRHTRCSRDWSSECALPICVVAALVEHALEHRAEGRVADVLAEEGVAVAPRGGEARDERRHVLAVEGHLEVPDDAHRDNSTQQPATAPLGENLAYCPAPSQPPARSE